MNKKRTGVAAAAPLFLSGGWYAGFQSVEDITESTESERFYPVYDRNTNTIRFNTRGTLNSNTLGQFTAKKSPRLKVKLKITFADYREWQPLEITVATENKKPSLGLTGMVTCPGISKGIVNVINSKTKETISMKEVPMTFEIVKPADGSVEAEIKIAKWLFSRE